ncbi:uncharacterized protein L969DRAFT_48089 [Mixia osmundae IAM 14324]|uniref:tRNA (guanine(26)-N(2))-dimethyltransferase n=1 Tax=Mixia osmundae (strain CBS 9802 / IAM 14324 / JCM 22182 / KY 12970) TaxID=764103 RepID=G7E8Q2_MIXOS|nr:uncharacterized protein L969DRAFT_48089 [Mixia osmundae IAM 14324]KEI40156.1 hypothetical protein L969DRAFT_48089 [Mixia osmundae IAM 14324]GAA99520.1 hypothetical protein E5Q_06221 [Mixia osmundae IAM 14324]
MGRNKSATTGKVAIIQREGLLQPGSRACPPNYILHGEGSTVILLPRAAPASVIPSGEAVASTSKINSRVKCEEEQEVFINPIQEYNRDLSVACIDTWSRIRAAERHEKASSRRAYKRQRNGANADDNAQGKRRKLDNDATEIAAGESRQTDIEEAAADEPDGVGAEDAPASAQPNPNSYKFTAFEALAASGLRSIRYARELPLLKWVQANDLSPKAVKLIQMNADFNELSDPDDAEKRWPIKTQPTAETIAAEIPEASASSVKSQAKVRVSQGDCCTIMYAERQTRNYNVIDLDPYGSAAPFIDAAVQAVADHGLLCITCTDLAVLAGCGYPEKTFSLYGGSPTRAEYSHEVALRLVLHAISSSAARYGRHIEPVLSLSIDYYLRVFVRVASGPIKVKQLASTTALVYVCNYCQSPNFQPMGRIHSRPTRKEGSAPQLSFGTATGPPTNSTCDQCKQTYHVAGPMWMGRLHDKSFVTAVIDHVEQSGDHYATKARMLGMLKVAQAELDAPFYFSPSKLASMYHCSAPPLNSVVNAVLNAGYSASRSHCASGSLKTDAPRSFLLAIIRKWIETHPVKLSNIKEGNPARILLAGCKTVEEVAARAASDSLPLEADNAGPSNSNGRDAALPAASAPSVDVNFDKNPQTHTVLMSQLGLAMYPTNPLDNWGPQKASST